MSVFPCQKTGTAWATKCRRRYEAGEGYSLVCNHLLGTRHELLRQRVMALVIGHNDQEIRLLTGLTQGERYQAQMKNSDDEQSHRGDWFDVDEIAISPPTKRDPSSRQAIGLCT